MTNAASTRQTKRARDQAANDRQTEIDVIRTLMSLPTGRRWVWLRLSQAEVFVEALDLDPYHMAYAKGRRSEGLRLLQLINRFTPDMCIRMVNENTTNPIPEEEESDGGPDQPSVN